jgi:hypothetical protein
MSVVNEVGQVLQFAGSNASCYELLFIYQPPPLIASSNYLHIYVLTLTPNSSVYLTKPIITVPVSHTIYRVLSWNRKSQIDCIGYVVHAS